jgi:ribonuclease HI
MAAELKQVTIYTDGACDPNPGGPGGYGVVLISGNTRQELSGGFRSTTNNRMEVFAAIQGLESLQTPCRVMLYSDSKYLVNAMSRGWVQRWKAHDWWRSETARAANVDLWERLLNQCEKHQVKFAWVRGHAGNRDNERCDQLSYSASKQAGLPADEGYVQRADDVTAEASAQMTHEGQPCRKCAAPVIKRVPHKKIRPDQLYYFEYYLYCPQCRTMYMVEEAKRYLDRPAMF